MKSITINWKTTVAGIGAIATAVGVLAHMYATDTWDANQIGMAVTGIAGGIGLIFAKDGNVTGGGAQHVVGDPRFTTPQP